MWTVVGHPAAVTIRLIYFKTGIRVWIGFFLLLLLFVKYVHPFERPTVGNTVIFNLNSHFSLKKK